MTRAALYARFSTDRQSDASIDDQFRVCRARAAALGLDVVAEHADQAVSGATRVGDRPGGTALLADALAGRFDVLLLEGLDRLARDQVEQEAIVRRLEHRAIRIVGCSDGYDTAAGKGRKILRGVRGLLNEVYLDDLADKVHRGLDGRVLAGLHAGGLSYGYRSRSIGANARGESLGHRLEVDEQQADVVRWIYAHYAAGWSCQRLAADLNARGVRGPRGGTWSVSALYGSPAKGAGVLNNELYVGRYVWNRSQWIKDPDTRKRQRFVRPRAEWRVDERPELRIVTDDAWRAVRARMDTPRTTGGRRGRGGAPTTLLGGLMRCGICGGPMIAINARDYGCAAHKDRGPAVCAGVRIRRQVAELRLTAHVRDELLAPARLAELERQVRERLAAIQRESAGAHRQAAARRAELDREIERLTDAIAAVGISPALAERLKKAERTREALDGPPARAPSVDVGSGLRAHLRARALDLAGALARDTARGRDVLRDLLGEVRLKPDGEALYAEFEPAADRALLAAGGVSLGRVAGEGFEPSTFGL